MRNIALITFGLIFCIQLHAQQETQRDKAIYKEKTNGFYQDSILPSIHRFNDPGIDSRTFLSTDISEKNFPTDPEKYKKLWHNHPLSQGATGTCWCFSTISFLESEVYRLHGKKVKLSEMYIVYWEYIARAEYFIDHRGKMYLGEGSETNAVMRNIKAHGMVPESVYNGKLKGQKFHDHAKMFDEINSYLENLAKTNAWDKTAAVSTVREIMDHYMTAPPEKFNYDGKEYSPMSFMNEFLQIKPDDYYCFMSTKSKTYNQKGELEEPDNWWHNDDYYNIHLDDFTRLFKDALESGYSIALCGDVSEPGYDRFGEVGYIPTFDIPGKYIDENSREYRIYNKTSTDDHCIHIVGIYNDNGTTWFMIKDSSSTGFDGPHKGYRFIREDYVKLKVLAAMVHKDGVRNVLDKIIK